jgi:DNA-binding transcriptional MerR regulator
LAERLLKIGEVAARAGVSNRTVDYYTNLGLITPTARTDGSFRLYHQGTVERITTIRQLEGLGVSLDDLTATLTANRHPDLAALLSRLDHDLNVLRTTADATSADAHGLLLTAANRAHSLITAAIDIALNLPPGP